MEFIEQHSPFFSVMAVLWLVGHFMSRSVFTYERAFSTHHKSKLSRGFWYWARESMELHPVAAGALIGLVWQNPKNLDPELWQWQDDVAYFASAGVASLFGWLLITKLLARFGVDTKGLTLPGESRRPPSSFPKPPKLPK